ncbi:MAG: hypothetical protein H6543_03815 [Prevotellaceae bacterium]|nr:hypothetical protein [Prevotellaceae bacterium]
MKKITFLVAALCATMFASAAEVVAYSITFNATGTTDGTVDKSASFVADLVATGAENIESVTGAVKCYVGKADTGVKLGSSKELGTFTLNLAEAAQVNATKIVVNAAVYGTDANRFDNGTATTDLSTTFEDKTFTLDGSKLTEIAIAAVTKRVYVKSITVYVNDAPVGIDQVTSMSVYANNGTIYGAENGRIYTILGMDVTEQNGNLKGIYVVKVGNKTQKIAVK